jgi:hypothetical protein
MQPTLDKLAPGKFARHQSTVRLVLIIGACLCFVIGAKWIAEDILYHVQLDHPLLFINALAFIPLLMLAPRYKNGKVVYVLIGLLEAFIIVMGNLLTLR